MALFYLFSVHGLEEGTSRLLKKCFEREVNAQRTAMKTLMYLIIDPNCQRFGESLFESLVQSGGNQTRIAKEVLLRLYCLGYMGSVVEDLLSRCACSEDESFRKFAEDLLSRCACSEVKKVRDFAVDMFVTLLRERKFEEPFVRVAHDKKAQETVVSIIKKISPKFALLVSSKNDLLFEQRILLESAAGHQLLANTLMDWMQNNDSKKMSYELFLKLAKSSSPQKKLLATSVLLELLDINEKQAQILWIACCSNEDCRAVAADVLRESLEKSCVEKILNGLAQFDVSERSSKYESVLKVLKRLSKEDRAEFSRYQVSEGGVGLQAFKQYLNAKENFEENYQQASLRERNLEMRAKFTQNDRGGYDKRSESVRPSMEGHSASLRRSRQARVR